MYDIPKVVDRGALRLHQHGADRPLSRRRAAGGELPRWSALVEEAARVTGIDSVTLRRRNLITPSAMPYKTPVGTTYDSGDFTPILAAGAAARRPGRLRQAAPGGARGAASGAGSASPASWNIPAAMPTEGAAVTFTGKDSMQLGLGLHSTGQGHATVFPPAGGRAAADRRRAGARAAEAIRALGVAGCASVASRGAMTVGRAMVGVVELVLEKGRKAASALLEAAEADIAYRDGHFEVVGTDRRLSLFEVAERSRQLAQQGAIAESLDSNIKADTPQAFPNGVPHRRGRDRSRDRRDGRSSPSRRSTIAATCSTTGSSRGRCTARSRRGSARC